MAESKTYRSYCPQCEEFREFGGEIVVMGDESTGAEGLCPVCGTWITQFLKAPTPGASQPK